MSKIHELPRKYPRYQVYLANLIVFPAALICALPIGLYWGIRDSLQDLYYAIVDKSRRFFSWITEEIEP